MPGVTLESVRVAVPPLIFFEPLEILENFDHFQNLQFWKIEGVESC